MNIIDELIRHERLFKAWLSENYSQEDIKNEQYDDTGYPDWVAIENTFERAFEELDFEKLNDTVLESIAFLLARQWDVGVIFPYFKAEISGVGMTEEQLLILVEYGLNSKEWSFQQQCAASIYKAKSYKKQAIEIALQYYKSKDSDIRRHALSSLYRLKYRKLKDLLIYSFALNDEQEMMLCLYIWNEIDKSQLKIKLQEVKNDKREYLKTYVNELLTTF